MLLEQEIERRTGYETRVTILGHVQRGGTPVAYRPRARHALWRGRVRRRAPAGASARWSRCAAPRSSRSRSPTALQRAQAARPRRCMRPPSCSSAERDARDALRGGRGGLCEPSAAAARARAGADCCVRVEASGVCRTDLHLLDGEVEIASPPRVLGHRSWAPCSAPSDGASRAPARWACVAQLADGDASAASRPAELSGVRFKPGCDIDELGRTRRRRALLLAAARATGLAHPASTRRPLRVALARG